MNIREYIVEQSVSCKNDKMKDLFLSLKDVFFPKPIEKKIEIYKSNTFEKSETSFIQRKVRVNIDNKKSKIGLICIDCEDIKLPDNERMIMVMATEQGTYYTYNQHYYFREKNSRIIKLVNKENYWKYKADICWLKDYCFKQDDIKVE